VWISYKWGIVSAIVFNFGTYIAKKSIFRLIERWLMCILDIRGDHFFIQVLSMEKKVIGRAIMGLLG
jgi:hypothetical protein